MTVVTTYLALTDPAQVRPAAQPRVAVAIELAQDHRVNQRMYETIGADWSWTDRLAWTDEQWRAWAARVETWVAAVDGETAGYYELDRRGDAVEIASFGLLPAFHGLGIGGHLLSHALVRGFELPGAERVWVHTCTLDGPHALANYRDRGMRVTRMEESG